MFDNFLNGTCAVYLDKDKPDLIKAFYEKIIDNVQGYSFPWGFTMLDYFLSPSSGPYFFRDKGKNRINGGTEKYVNDQNMTICFVEEILTENPVEISETEYIEIFN